MPLLLAPGRIIYFSNWGGRSRERPASASSAGSSEERGAAPGVSGSRVLAPRAGSVMLAVSLKWRLGVVRRRPKGTGPRGWGWTGVRMEGGGRKALGSPGFPSPPCYPLLRLDPICLCAARSGSLSLNLCV